MPDAVYDQRVYRIAQCILRNRRLFLHSRALYSVHSQLSVVDFRYTNDCDHLSMINQPLCPTLSATPVNSSDSRVALLDPYCY